MISDVHRKYYEAGARLIETNTFSANREKLSKYGLADQVVEALIVLPCALQERQQAMMPILLGGRLIVPEGVTIYALEQLSQHFAEQFQVLLAERVDAILLETFSHFRRIAARA